MGVRCFYIRRATVWSGLDVCSPSQSNYYRYVGFVFDVEMEFLNGSPRFERGDAREARMTSGLLAHYIYEATPRCINLAVGKRLLG